MLRVKLSFSGQIPGIFYKIKVETGKKVPDCVKEKKKARESLLLVLVLGLAAALE